VLTEVGFIMGLLKIKTQKTTKKHHIYSKILFCNTSSTRLVLNAEVYLVRFLLIFFTPIFVILIFIENPVKTLFVAEIRTKSFVYGH
jgi:hypothetical protein